MDTPKRIIDVRTPAAALAHSVRDGKLIAGCMDGVYQVDLDAKDVGKSVRKIDQHESYVSSVAHVPKQDLIVTAGYDGAVHWIDAKSGDRKRRQTIHKFWSWDMDVSPDGKWIASVTGQYLSGGYKYEPQSEREPSLKVLSAASGEIVHELPHVPSVQSVAFSNNSQWVAAGNLMGEVRVFNVETGKLASTIETPAFTSWGVIKSHCYLGGVFALKFAPDDQSLLLAGMGPMRDPMAGNGRQLWQRWSWRDGAKLTAEIKKDQAGEGLMEALAIHPSGKFFAMGGRLRGGKWNVGLFDLDSGDRIAELKTGYRVTDASFSDDGKRLILVGTQGQPKSMKDGQFPDFGRIETYKLG